MLASGSPQVFFLGLLITTLGTGMLKPNVSAIVAQLYRKAARDATPVFRSSTWVSTSDRPEAPCWFLCSPTTSAGTPDSRYPAAGMLIGLVQFLATRHYLGASGIERAPDAKQGTWTPVIVLVVAIAAVVGLALHGSLQIDANAVGIAATWIFSALALGYFAYLCFFAGLGSVERKRVYVMAALFVGSTMFWAGFEQMGASFNLFAARYTDLHVLGFDIPPGVLQGVNPTFIIIFAPALAAVWVGLGRRNRDFSAPTKFALGLLLMGGGFLRHVYRLATRHRRYAGTADLAHLHLPVT